MKKGIFFLGLGALAAAGVVLARKASAAPAPDEPQPLAPVAKAKALGEIDVNDPAKGDGRTPLERAAEELDAHLRANPEVGTESKAMVMAFQKLAKLKADGLYGYGTAAKLSAILNRTAPPGRYGKKAAPKPLQITKVPVYYEAPKLQRDTSRD